MLNRATIPVRPRILIRAIVLNPLLQDSFQSHIEISTGLAGGTDFPACPCSFDI
jgi:hypothetical protein